MLFTFSPSPSCGPDAVPSELNAAGQPRILPCARCLVSQGVERRVRFCGRGATWRPFLASQGTHAEQYETNAMFLLPRKDVCERVTSSGRAVAPNVSWHAANGCISRRRDGIRDHDAEFEFLGSQLKKLSSAIIYEEVVPVPPPFSPSTPPNPLQEPNCPNGAAKNFRPNLDVAVWPKLVIGHIWFSQSCCWPRFAGVSSAPKVGFKGRGEREEGGGRGEERRNEV